MTAWLVRATKETFESAAPSDMAARYGGTWVDGNGNAVTNALGIFRPDLSLVTGFASKYWLLVGDLVTLMTAPQRAQVDADELSAQRDAVALQMQQTEDVLRAFMLVVLDELNLHAAKHNAILTAIDNNTTLATIRTAIAAIADYPARTELQLRNSVRGRLGS